MNFDHQMHVELDAMMGNEQTIINRMTVSTNRDGQEWDEKRDVGRLNRIIRDNHSSPFEFVRFDFLVTVPIFVAREWFRHRKGSFNEMSGRYTEMLPHFYVPKEARKQVGKAMSYTYEPMAEEDTAFLRTKLHESFLRSWSDYMGLLTSGNARELARIILPNSIYTRFYWGVDLRNLTNFLTLRNHPAAMSEIRDAAVQVEEIVKDKLPIFYQLWVENGRPRLAAEDF